MRFWECIQTHYGLGQTMVKSSTLEHHQGIEDTMLRPIFEQEAGQPRKESYMPEFLVKNNEMILLGKSVSLEADIQRTRSSKILAVDSTSKEKVFEPFWTELCAEMSQKWLSLTKTGCVGSDLICSNTLQQSTTAESWFSTTLFTPLNESLLRTYFPSFMCSPVDFTDCENTIIRSKKIRIYPKSKNRMKQYLGLSRYWYNKAVEYLQRPGTHAILSEVRSIQEEVHPEWAFDCPQRIREHALADAVNAMKNAKKKSKGGVFQKVSFRSRKDRKQRFGFDKKSLKEGFCFSKKSDRVYFESSESFEAELEGTEVVLENGRWFLILPQKRQVKRPENQRLPLVALDPGVRTFITLYSPWMTGSFGDADFGRIHRLCLHLDNLMSQIATGNGKRKHRMKKAAQRMRWKLRDLIDDCHNKIAHFLVSRFETILLPTFETSEMVSKLRSKTARAMLTWSHYRFKQKLKAKAEEYSAQVIEVCEAYTSKTCSYCGKIQNMGSKKRMKCQCGVDVDRDQNGARGIMLRALSASTSLP